MKSIAFTDHKAADGQYLEITVNSSKVLESWRVSLFSFEWLDQGGNIKPLEGLPEKEQVKRRAVETALERGEAIAKPVLGIGIQDNVEIGSGRAEFLTLAARGLREIPVYIRKGSEKDFKPFLASVE